MRMRACDGGRDMTDERKWKPTEDEYTWRDY